MDCFVASLACESDVRREHPGDSRNHHPEPGERPPDGAALRADRRRPRADLRPDGRRELRPRRIPDDRDVRDVLPVRVLRDRSVAVGAAGRRGAVRVRRGGLSADRALCGARQSQCRHGADLLHLRPRHRHARPGAVLLHAGLSQRHPFLARRQDRLGRPASSCPCRNWSARLVAIAAFGALYFFINRTDFGRALEATREDAGAVALVGIDKNQRVRAGLGPRRGAGRASPAPSWRSSSTSIPTSARRLR